MKINKENFEKAHKAISSAISERNKAFGVYEALMPPLKMRENGEVRQDTPEETSEYFNKRFKKFV